MGDSIRRSAGWAVPGSPRRRRSLVLAGLIAFGAALRFAGLGEQSYWLDESFTVLVVDRDLGGMLDAIPDSESTPPLYYVLAWGWSKVFGTGEAGLRSLSALLGTATIPAAYAVGRRLVSERAGLVLAALAAVNPFLVWYSQEARAYALAILLGTLSIWCAARGVEEAEAGAARRALAAWAVVAAAAVASHYFAGLLVVVEVVWLLRATATRRAALAAVAGVALVVAALVPLAVAQRDNQGASGFDEAALVDRVKDVPKEFLLGEFGGPVRGLGPLCALLLAAALVLLVARGSPAERRRALVPALIGAGVIGLALAGAAAGADYLTPRHLAVAWVPLFAVAAAGLATERARAAGLGLTVALTAVFAAISIAVPLDPELQRDDWRGAADSLGRRDGPRAILMSPATGFVPLSLYEPGTAAPPGESFAVTEIDVIAMTRSDGPRLPPNPPAPGFRPLKVQSEASFAIARYVSGRPRTVNAAQLRALRLTGEPTGVVYQP